MSRARRILSISSSRADASILRPVWRALAAAPTVELHVLTTGMHCAAGSAEIDTPTNVIRHSGGADLGGGDSAQAFRGMAVCAEAVATLIDRISFDCMLLIGDRLDMLPAAFAALPRNLPLAHIHGGELTYGAMDDRARHAMTKMSHLHFVSSVEAAQRVCRMGEEPWRTHITGAPGLDWLRQAPILPPPHFAARLGLPFGGGFLLVTVHPETNSPDPVAPMRSVLAALETIDAPILFTAPNSDPEGNRLRSMIDDFLSRHETAFFRDTLGPELYPSALRHAAAMVGNSSSGPIEAGFFGLPVVDVGARQQGRAAGANVRRVESDAQAIEHALRAILDSRARFVACSLYGDGQASERIAQILTDLPDRARLLHKLFAEVGAPPVLSAPWTAAAP